MSAELIAVLIVGILLAGIWQTGVNDILVGLRELRVGVRDLSCTFDNLCERVIRLQHLFDGPNNTNGCEPKASAK